MPGSEPRPSLKGKAGGENTAFSPGVQRGQPWPESVKERGQELRSPSVPSFLPSPQQRLKPSSS